jgi:hypothetical protein
MASGIDLSARLICLAINIAVMGFILEKGGFALLMLYGGLSVWLLAAISFMIFGALTTAARDAPAPSGSP